MLKLKNKKGFTLMEMLIVVAIIAILVAIAIPTFTSSLEKAKQGADNANVRALYAEVATAQTLGEDTDDIDPVGPMQAAYDGTTIIGGVDPDNEDTGTIGWDAGDMVTVTIDEDDGTVTIEGEGSGD